MRTMEIQNAYGLENLVLVDQPKPEPGPGEVLVKLKAACINYRDLATVLGFGGQYPLPLVPLSDGAGEIEAVGADVSRVAVGDRVCPIFFPYWLDGPVTQEGLSRALGGTMQGCAREYICLPADGVVNIPDYLSDIEAACLPCAAVTAWRALVVEGGLKAGETVLVQGTGGVSMFALQFAKALGANVIATSSSDEKLERARELGADHLINYKKTTDWGRAARKITGERGVDHVVEVGGAETLQQSLTAIRVGGNVVVIGLLSGLVKDMNVASIFAQNARVIGITVGSRAHFEDMLKTMDASKIKPIVDSVYPLGELRTALEHMQAGGHFGKVAIEIAL